VDVKRAQRQLCANCSGLIEKGKYASAAARLRRAAQRAPECGEIQQNLGKALFYLGQTDAAVEAFCKASALLGPSERTFGNLAIIIPGSPAADNQAILKARQAWGMHCSPTGPRPSTLFRRRAGARRLRLGYVSSLLQHRNWMKPVWGLINRHDRATFQVHLFSDAPEAHIRHGYHRRPGDRFHDISGRPNTEVARLIRKEAIDILIDLNSFSSLPRLPLFCHAARAHHRLMV
jgi:protein O-GlcNAc transferase